MTRRRRAPFVAGNWKMNLGLREAADLSRKIVEARASVPEATLVLIPPYTALAAVAGAIAGSDVGLGAQDLYWEKQGAFTGEVSGPMLRDAGCGYVLVGHSERRQLFGETDETVGRKTRAALESGLTPIVCVGEVLEERDAGRALERIDAQLAKGLGGLSKGDLSCIVIAYEPVWAIGTGRTATPVQAEEVHAHIRQWIADSYGNEAAACAIILYGGSVKPANSYPLFRENDIDGFLVGGASLDAGGFIGIVGEALRAHREEK
ncbi:MAG TPA: triose-phosphate isomerase [Candidatus Aminicenantes bacterium]|nr:triose-phosphate isomerase [Candidatus Aminicenantes bacterium]HRY66217.1 triose-phosphate isomerase [Candidatus Aminicenantes bacterium]HRZ73131.1 triose-phosphate isomerase [Candidatus Aminicenantes bacterium]